MPHVVFRRRRRDEGSAGSVGVIGATLIVALTSMALWGAGLPERVGCEIEAAVAQVGAGPDPVCAPGEVPAAAASPLPNRAGGGLTAITRSSTGIRAIGDPVGADPSGTAPGAYARCAAAPDGSGTWICLAGDDAVVGGDVFTGSERVLRCSGSDPRASMTSAEVCADTAMDVRTSLRTGPDDGDARFCQPLGLHPAAGDPDAFVVDWACASWAGDLFHCSTIVAAQAVAVRDSRGGWRIREDWTTDQDHRARWPRRCDSRTFPPTSLACTPDRPTHLADCAVRAYQGLPLRPATCAYFPAERSERGRPSFTVDRPMHCRLTPSGLAVEVDPDDRCLVRQEAALAASTPTEVFGLVADQPAGSLLRVSYAYNSIGTRVLARTWVVVEPGEACTPGQRALLARIADLQTVRAALAGTAGGSTTVPDVPDVPVVILNDPSGPVRQAFGSRAAFITQEGSEAPIISVDDTLADSHLVLLHEYGHAVETAFNPAPLTSPDMELLSEGFAQTFAYLTLPILGRDIGSIPVLPVEQRAIKRYDGDVRHSEARSRDPHDNGALLYSVYRSIERSWHSTPYAAQVPAGRDQTAALRGLLILTASRLSGKVTLTQYRAQTLLAAEQLGLSVDTVAAAFDQQDWPT